MQKERSESSNKQGSSSNGQKTRQTFESLNKFRDQRKAKHNQLESINSQKDAFKNALFDSIRDNLHEFLRRRRGAIDDEDADRIWGSIQGRGEGGIFGDRNGGGQGGKDSNPWGKKVLSPLEQLASFRALRDSMDPEERKKFEQEIAGSMVSEINSRKFRDGTHPLGKTGALGTAGYANDMEDLLDLPLEGGPLDKTLRFDEDGNPIEGPYGRENGMGGERFDKDGRLLLDSNGRGEGEGDFMDNDPFKMGKGGLDEADALSRLTTDFKYSISDIEAHRASLIQSFGRDINPEQQKAMERLQKFGMDPILMKKLADENGINFEDFAEMDLDQLADFKTKLEESKLRDTLAEELDMQVPPLKE